MIFDELLKHHDERFFGEKIINGNIEIYPYYEIKLTTIGNNVNAGEITTLALLFVYDIPKKSEKEYYLQFINKSYMKYKNEVIEKFKNKIL